ncbi:DUF559 domain-containing protein [Candidatus Peribacteria bacterium]|nr:DUF559 domain-containing protein [Candidatus Peribacteria bacterium]
MFTGIIEATAKILSKGQNTLALERPKSFDDIKIGSSIAVSGVCLSVIAFDAKSISFDVVETTLKKTKLGSLSQGDVVNLERAMKADGRFEGHIVLGHCEGVGKVVSSSLSGALSPSPSPVPGAGDAAEKTSHVWKGVAGLTYPPSSVVANARAMRKEPTKAEKLLWEALRKHKIKGYYFRRQRPIGSCIIDFYCEELHIGIEVDGGIHDEKEQRMYDEWRSEHLALRGIRLVRFTNDQIMHHMSDVIASIELHCKVPLPPEGGGVRGGGTERGGQNILLTISLPSSLRCFIVHYGSITIDGVALTVADCMEDRLSVALIPHTLEHSTLGVLQAGDSVNLETDILGKYILQAHDNR